MSKTYLNLDEWARKEHFHFFRTFDEPFYGATVTVDCTRCYEASQASGISFFVYYLHKTLQAVNDCEPFRYRIEGERVAIFDRVDVSATIGRNDGSFGFSFMEYDPGIDIFAKRCKIEMDRIQDTPGLFTREFTEKNLIHFSALPWVNFTSLSHARSFNFEDSCPKISFGSMTVSAEGRRTMPMSVHVHHALIDGLHLGQFIDRLNHLMDL